MPYWWRKCRIGAQGTEGSPKYEPGGSGWRVVTKNGTQSCPGGMDYEHDMKPYIQDMADWADDDREVYRAALRMRTRGLKS